MSRQFSAVFPPAFRETKISLDKFSKIALALTLLSEVLAVGQGYDSSLVRLPDWLTAALYQRYWGSTPEGAKVANFKATFIFNQGKSGWSEILYFTKTTIDGALTAAANVAEKRGGMMASDVVLEAVRVSDESVSGDSLVKFVNIIGPVVNKQEEGPGDLSSVGWQARLDSGSTYRRAYWIRGMPDVWVRYTSTHQPILDPDLLSSFNAWKASVVANGGQMRVISKVGLDRQTQQVLYVIQDGTDPTLTRVGTLANHTFAIGDRVYLARVKMVPTNIYPIPFPVNGQHTVLAVASTLSFTLNLRWRSTWAYQSGGTVYKVVYKYENIDSLKLERPGKRNTGRAFFVPAGRRPAR